ncbi:hypothetical protein MLD38_022399 [Melastoma candidum]|uniref:Uncharacterized protein n=1 Tax=Melastoma candidum TaxID=119954 RepID=A0ACB9QJM7_9MYRT|nr:hypothetical protein MLD38_022399 [Melastoma candidum]
MATAFTSLACLSSPYHGRKARNLMTLIGQMGGWSLMELVFRFDDESDDSFAVLVPCYGRDYKDMMGEDESKITVDAIDVVLTYYLLRARSMWNMAKLPLECQLMMHRPTFTG